MKVSEARTIAEAIVNATEKSGEQIAKGMVKSTANIANAIIDNNTKNAKALREVSEKLESLSVVQGQNS